MPDNTMDIPKAKQTVLGLYITSKDAYAQWQAEPEKIKIIDVRTPEEYIFVGHPTVAWKIPAFAQTYQWDEERKQFPMKPLPDFVARVGEIASPDDTLMVMCRAGGRAAIAANLLAEAGFKSVYNIVDGMEGDSATDADGNPAPVNGWKNSACPWTMKLTPERMLLPKAD